MIIKKYLLAASIALSFYTPANADVSDTSCEKALAPRVTETSSDERKHQSYVYENAERDWDELTKNNNDATSLGGSYAGYGLEFGSSSSGAEFSKKVRDRLRKEGFVNDASTARSYYRRDLAPEQLTAWTECIKATSKSALPAMLLSPGKISNNGFVITASYHYGNSQPGDPKKPSSLSNPKFTSRDGIISNISPSPFSGDNSTSFDVVPKSPKQKTVSVKATVNGASDDIVVDLRPPKVQAYKTHRIELVAYSMLSSGDPGYVFDKTKQSHPISIPPEHGKLGPDSDLIWKCIQACESQSQFADISATKRNDNSFNFNGKSSMGNQGTMRVEVEYKSTK